MDPLKKLFSRRDSSRPSTATDPKFSSISSRPRSARDGLLYSSAYSDAPEGKAPQVGGRPVQGNGPGSFRNRRIAAQPPSLPHPLEDPRGRPMSSFSQEFEAPSPDQGITPSVSAADRTNGYRLHTAKSSTGSAKLPIADQFTRQSFYAQAGAPEPPLFAAEAYTQSTDREDIGVNGSAGKPINTQDRLPE